MKGKIVSDEVKEPDVVMVNGRHIARETSDMVYSRDRERYRKTDIVDDSNSV